MAMILDRRTFDRPMPADLARDGDRYILTADLPGVDADSIDVSVDGRRLTIRAERARRDADGVTWIARERSDGAVTRRFALGEGIDPAGITADYDAGVLRVELPVSEAAKPRRVAVTTGGSSRDDAASHEVAAA